MLHLGRHSASAPYGAVFAEEEAYSPDCRQSDQDVDNAGKNRTRAAEKPSDKIESEDTYKTPVNAADD
jgi:hypothetical protein